MIIGNKTRTSSDRATNPVTHRNALSIVYVWRVQTRATVERSRGHTAVWWEYDIVVLRNAQQMYHVMRRHWHRRTGAHRDATLHCGTRARNSRYDHYSLRADRFIIVFFPSPLPNPLCARRRAHSTHYQ